jgi:hypothetical protein
MYHIYGIKNAVSMGFGISENRRTFANVNKQLNKT